MPSGFTSIGAATAQGPRETQQDRYLATTQLLMVADGMGGHAGGDIAADLALAAFRARLPTTRDALVRVLHEAHGAILATGRTPGLRGLGTTCTAVLWAGPMAYVAHVGDSRALWVGHTPNGVQTWRWLTFDQTVAGALLAAGQITADQYEDYSGALIGVLGQDEREAGKLEVAAPVIQSAPGNVFLVMSDGLYRVLAPHEMAAACTPGDSGQVIAARLLRRAARKGLVDNTTVVVGVM